MKLEVTVQVTPKLDRAQRPHPPPSPGSALQIERDLVPRQRTAGHLGLLRGERDRERLHYVVEYLGIIFPHVERVGAELCDVQPDEAEHQVHVVEARVGLGIVVLGFDVDAYLGHQNPGQVDLEGVEARADDADEGHPGVDDDVADEHGDARDDRGHRDDGADDGRQPDD